MSAALIYAIVLVPLVTCLFSGLLGSRLPERIALGVPVVGVVLSALASVVVFYHIGFGGADTITGTLFTWIDVGNFTLSFGVLVDKLTATMLLVVTSVSACVHIYSLGYMAHDPARVRFMAYLSLFTFTMLTLVTAPNLLQMFLGWEGVGLASYLLIGFWYQKQSACAASLKAFVVNRVADLGLLLGIFTLFITVGTLDYANIFMNLDDLSDKTLTFFGVDVSVVNLTALLLFIGAMGKSAQLGFHTWLPDAMEGPTPVSALIHAATMVTAGVFLLSRMSPLFEMAPDILTIVAWVGGLTAFFAATVGLVQTDIKRVIAYSTCSQLGYMFMACGVGAYPAAIFHLTTHAFFKALLFLGAGSVIHAVGDEQNMLKMGGLRRALPVTYVLMWVGSLALMGIPPLAGFFSKDMILESAFMTDGAMWLYMLGTLAALMTAFYSIRVMHLTFHRTSRAEQEVHPHESPLVMVVPMLVLLVGAVISGFTLKVMSDTSWWQGAIVVADDHTGLANAHLTPAFYKYLPLVLGLVGAYIATIFYLKHPHIPRQMAAGFGSLYQLVLQKWYVDELYQKVIVRPVQSLAKRLWLWGDVGTIDRYGPHGVARFVLNISDKIRTTQTGYVYHYAFYMVIGVTVMLSLVML